jgi:hypothetical protein
MGLAESPHPPFAAALATVLELIGDQPIAELGIIGVHVNDHVGGVRVRPVAIRDRLGLPLVERLGGETEHPAGHRHGEPLDGQVTDQRELHFGSASLAKYAALGSTGQRNGMVLLS